MALEYVLLYYQKGGEQRGHNGDDKRCPEDLSLQCSSHLLHQAKSKGHREKVRQGASSPFLSPLYYRCP